MRIFQLFVFLIFSALSAQEFLPFDSLKLKDASDFLVDDYQNFYIVKNQSLSVTRYDSLGVQNGRLLFALPFRIQTVQNPLRIPAFSANTQQLKFFDQNLNETETMKFSPETGFVTAAFSEDPQRIWLLDGAFRRLAEYDFRQQKIINAYLLPIDYEKVTDFIVFEGKMYLLTDKNFAVYDFKGEKLFSAEVQTPKRLRRENGSIYIISKDHISEFSFPDKYINVFQGSPNSIVDKNSAGFFEIKDAKLYLYGTEKRNNKQ